MPAVNRESFAPLQSAELEHAEAPHGAVSPVVTQQVESFEESKAPSHAMRQGSAVGSIAASRVGELDAKAVVAHVKELMGGWYVSDDDCRHAVGLLQSLPRADCGKALKALSESGTLRTLCEKTPDDLRHALADAAVQGGMTTATRERFSSMRDPQPPPQPSLIVNSPSLPPELRQVIHQENEARARQYEAAFAGYVDAWCAKVKTCKTPLELRKLGLMSSPPALTEPGISSEDFAARRFTSLHTHSGLGAEKASKAVSNQVSVFRNELAAGSFGLDFKLKAQLKVEGEGPGHTEGGVGSALIAKGTFSQDGRVINQGVESESFVELGRGPAKVEAKLNAHGHLEAVSGQMLGAGVELERDGKVTFKAPVAPGLGVETFSDPNKGTMGAALVAKEEATVFGSTLELGAKIGFTAQGIAREYYQDIGGAQEGFFGPMPELDAGAKWSDLKTERRDWYHRQGFDENNWPST